MYKAGDVLGPYKTELIERTVKIKNVWKGCFKCAFCGTMFEARLGDVASGRTKSCGCLQKQNAIKQGKLNFVDLIDKRFGKLKVISCTNRKTKSGNYIWKCKCDCENIKEVSNSDLKSGKVLSCGCLNSKGEALIKSILDKEKINYFQQYYFSDCRSSTGTLLKFDFYLPDYNCCIEYDGEQHFFSKENGWNTKENLILTKQRDAIKNKYCKDNSINIIRIPYTDYKKISWCYLKSLLTFENK